MKIWIKTFSLVICVLTFDLLTLSAVELLKDDFKTPPNKNRIFKIVHSLPDSDANQTSLFEKLKKQGFGGIVCNLSFEKYLESEEKWNSFINGVKKSKQMGFSMWLYDERGYPSGNAGGLVLKDRPEWEALGLVIFQTNVIGNNNIKFEIPQGKLIYAKANQSNSNFIELSNNIKERILEWSVPAGKWRIDVVVETKIYEGTHAEQNLWQKLPYLNIMQREPVERFIQLTHDEYAKRLGKNLGEYFEATFTDEPSLMSVFLRQMPFKVLPWGDNLPTEFKNRRGYSIDKTIPSLFTEPDPNWKKYRYDYWLTVGELVSENYFGQIRDWCRKHNIASGGHLLAEENIVHHVPFYGDFFRCIKMLDAPGIDCLTSIPDTVPWYIAKIVSSAARLQDKRLVMCETSDHGQNYRPKGDTRPKRMVTEGEIRGTLNRLFINGINRITSYYTFNQLDDNALIRLNEWCGRCSSLVETSIVEPDIAVLYPIETLWIRFIPSSLWTRDATEAAKIETIYKAIIEGLFSSQRDFLIIDNEAITKGTVKNGVLNYNGLQFRTIILPGVDTLPLKVWSKLSEFVNSGGILFLVGNLPENSETEFPSPKVKNIVNSWFGSGNISDDALLSSSVSKQSGIVNFLPIGFASTIADLISVNLPSQVKINGNHNNIRVSKRTIQGNTLFFVINDSAVKWNGSIEFKKCNLCEIYNPGDGSVISSGTNLFSGMEIEPYGAKFFKFKTDDYSKDLAIRKGKTSAFSLKSQNIKHNPPNTGKGEFVKAEITDETDNKGAKMFKADATLTKGGVDTWLFLNFHITDSSSFNPNDAIAFKVNIPAKQDVKNQLLVIVKEKNGGDFIAETGIFLNEAGIKTIYVPFKKLRLAGWSKDNDGILDVKNIEDIRIGWGGYLGSEDENILFSSNAPELVTLKFQ